MKCPDIAPLVPRFFDGELDGPLMRKIALHITRCADCEGELRSLERIQVMVADHFAAEIRNIDLDSIWPAVSSRIDEVPRGWTQRLETWWDDLEIWSPLTVWPALAAAAAVFLAVNLWTGGATNPSTEVALQPRGVEITERIVEVRNDSLLRDAMEDFDDNSAVLESIVGGVDTLMVEPKTQTTVLWIDDTGDFR